MPPKAKTPARPAPKPAPKVAAKPAVKKPVAPAKAPASAVRLPTSIKPVAIETTQQQPTFMPIAAPPQTPTSTSNVGDRVDSTANRSARAAVQKELDRYGLGGLGQWAWDSYLNGTPVEQIMLDLRDRPEYKSRFAGMDQLAQKGRAITESQWIEYEQQAASLMRSYGLPPGFYDSPQDFSKFITGEVSLSELNDRLSMGQQAAVSAPKETRDALQALYGIDSGGLTAYYLDPDRALPVIKQQYASAQVAGGAAQAGYGQVARDQAERLAAMGVTQEQARAGYGQAKSMDELTMTLPGEKASQLGRDTVVSAVLGGDQDARERVQRRQAQRKAAFGDRGSFAATAQGVGGLGSSTA